MQAKKLKPTRFYLFRLDIFSKILYNTLMNKYKFLFSGLIKTLLAVAFLITLFGVGYNIYSLIAVKNLTTLNITGYILLIVVNLLVSVICISIVISSKYFIKNGNLYTNFGIIFTKIPLSDITDVIHFLKSDKLVLYYGENKYTVLVIESTLFADFVSALTKANPKITYSVKNAEEKQ